MFGAVVLAAGLSTRMGDNKLLLPWRDGQPIVAHVAAKYVRAGIDETVVVTGRDAADVRAAVAGLGVRCVHNPDFADGGMISSVQAGLRALDAGLAAAFIQPADMPLAPVHVILRLAAAHVAGFSVAPVCEGRRGHPMLLDRAAWEKMLAVARGGMPRDGLDMARLRTLDVADPGVLVDVDTRNAYERALTALRPDSNPS